MKDDIKPNTDNRSVDGVISNGNQSQNRIHSIVHKTQKAYQNTIKQPVINSVNKAKQFSRGLDITKSKNISHFGQKEPTAIKTSIVKNTDAKPTRHPMAVKADIAKSAKQTQPTVAATNQMLKQAAIDQAMNKVEKTNPVEKKKGFFKKHLKTIVIAFVSIILVLSALIGVYYFVPSLSIKVAANQAGVEATYPQYHPDGYSLNAPILFKSGEVTIKFHSNSGSDEFSISQINSSWDSTALKNQVNKDSSGEFLTLESNGLTIYTYDHSASWVNGGILYTISGTAPLSSDQIQRIATSF